MLRKPGICQKPVITLYETPAYAACGTVVGAEPTGVQPGACTPENGGVADEILFGWQYEVFEYYGTAEPPVRCGESHLSGLTEPLHFVY